MGIVFTWDQIKSREIPEVADIVEVAGIVKSLFALEQDVVAGVIYGSYIHNALTIRSDVDVMVVYHSGSQRIKNRVAEALHIAGQKFVSLEIGTVDAAIATTKFHDYGPLMLSHLARAASKQGCIKKDPCLLLSPNVASAEEDVVNYLRHKRAFFEERQNYLYYLSDSERCHLLRKILEVATHVGRRVISLHDGPKAADSKQAVLERYPQLTNQRSAELFHYLIGADNAYSKQVVAQLNGEEGPLALAERKYQKTTRSIQAALPIALEFIRENSLMLSGK